MATPGTEDIRPTEAELPARLEPVIHRRLPDTAGTRITNWRAAERGMSTETFLFDLQRDGPDGPVTVRRLVFRRPPAVSLFPDYDLLRQVLVMNRLRDTEVPVPTVCWLDRDGMELGTPYYVMEQIPTIGSPGDFPSYHCAGMYFDATSQQRTTMWTGCVRAMADVHTLDWRALRLDALLMPDRGRHPLEQVVDYYTDALHWASDGDPRPELAAAAEWLRRHLYEPEHLALCWGDSRLSNILYGEDFAVNAVVDWEIAYIGDHEADLAWFLFIDWAFSEYEGTPRLPGTPGRDETIELYQRLSGLPVRNLRYNELLAVLALSVPVTRLETKLRSDGLLAEGFDLLGFCVERARQLLG
ncbi:phosphotransferase family protein [Mycolicibacterium thermoresistibile]|uniref:Aminoglycoside phosphotransferase domain-containing protein n=2 Tax=Mycolicibacterium thermoresistibile TaxID=1797 RepID=G7CM17_MYCT3|nr:phosphotransferase family protein [Mycolicibacterium thermoresistibile]EHI10970.1 hypothetical protein KEK_20298 [Mycolicibacterium thermoresistibile ATCC 19527]MCV7188268.1 phosphotransferase family protein [Mycolicibacterium thermoresistibile]GAT13348.1 putative uncharacterized protein [Mycolicibacterium thermoresistibile]SNW18477.1 putative aminoglycoside phosphotransferase [Mycolicibacterium thermoresistibile]